MAEIWVIDDDRSVRFVLAEALREAGFVVRDFDNARAALDVLGARAARRGVHRRAHAGHGRVALARDC